MNLAPRTVAFVPILNGASVSAPIDLQNTAIVGFVAPGAWTTAALNFEFSLDKTNWFTTVYDSTGAQVGSYTSFTAGAGYALDPLAFLPWRYVRLRSGTLASPVNQGADRTFSLVTRPLA